MIRVTPQEPPTDFDEKVANPGNELLRRSPDLSNAQLRQKGLKFWKRCRSQLSKKYSHTCSYSAEWIPEAKRTVDHYVPISADRNSAFVWSNYRLASKTLNENKGDQWVIDPFKVADGWFQIRKDSLLVEANKSLPFKQQLVIWDTINKLRLNEFTLFNRRISAFRKYKDKEKTLRDLSKYYPFLVAELRRHGFAESFEVAAPGDVPEAQH